MADSTVRQLDRPQQLHLVLGFPGLTLGDPDYYAASVLSTAFGGGMSSRLFQEVREKRGLAYTIHSFAHSYRDGGLFGIYAGTGESDIRSSLSFGNGVYKSVDAGDNWVHVGLEDTRHIGRIESELLDEEERLARCAIAR